MFSTHSHADLNQTRRKGMEDLSRRSYFVERKRDNVVTHVLGSALNVCVNKLECGE